ncbi:hypothetical protein [Candidatus Amarobacter glycogenicus]|uniref:hypothetical protein n=1 Tax=Candidatus Amarobacter glycogenicus TaxID=3140699 RepID=UPI002A157A0B|nr:hypothetical protein [Dehalococcoidia bacterium]
MRRGRQVGAVTAIVAVLAVSVVLGLPSDDRQGGSAPALTSPQDVMAESGGVTLAISGAEFSGTATFIELAARVAGAAPDRVTRVSIPAMGFVSGNMAPADLTASIMLIANGPATIQRLRPVSAVGPVKMVVSFVDVDDGRGHAESRVTGCSNSAARRPDQSAAC